jgi:hypothetical protein
MSKGSKGLQNTSCVIPSFRNPKQLAARGRCEKGIIWHTQGSGKNSTGLLQR